MVFDFAVHNIIGGEHMIVFHVEMIAIVVFFDAAFPVVAGVDVNSVVEHMQAELKERRSKADY